MMTTTADRLQQPVFDDYDDALPSWTTLPADLQELVLAQLSPAELKRVRSVCREWLASTDSPNFRQLHKQLHSRINPSLLLYNHSVKISAVNYNTDPSDHWRDLPVPAAYVREWAGSGGLVCIRSHLNHYTVGCPFSNRWRNLPSPPPPQSPTTLSKLWSIVVSPSVDTSAAARFWVVLLHRSLGSLSFTVFDSECNQWQALTGDQHIILLSSFSDTAHSVGSVIYSIQRQSRSVVAYDVRRNAWKSLGGGPNFLPADLVFQITQGDVLADTPPAVIQGHRGALLLVGAAAASAADGSYQVGVIWQLDRVRMEWRSIGRAPLAMCSELVGEAVECRKADLLPIRYSGHGELVVVMAAGSQRAIQFDVAHETWAWLELPAAVNCDLSVCFQPPATSW